MQENIINEMDDIELQPVSDEELDSVAGGATTGTCSATGGPCKCHPQSPIPFEDS